LTQPIIPFFRKTKAFSGLALLQVCFNSIRKMHHGKEYFHWEKISIYFFAVRITNFFLKFELLLSICKLRFSETKDHLLRYKKFLQQQFQLTEEESEMTKEYFQLQTSPKNEYFISQGKVSRKLAFIAEGVMRYCMFRDDGTEAQNFVWNKIHKGAITFTIVAAAIFLFGTLRLNLFTSSSQTIRTASILQARNIDAEDNYRDSFKCRSHLSNCRRYL
jgi:hypothetical protein